MPDLLMAEMGWRASAFSLDIWENLEAEPYNFDRSVLLDNVIGQITNDQDQVIGVENAYAGSEAILLLSAERII